MAEGDSRDALATTAQGRRAKARAALKIALNRIRHFRFPSSPPLPPQPYQEEVPAAQEGLNDIEIRPTLIGRGYGLFATRELPRGYKIIHEEEPVLSGHPLSLQPKWNTLSHRKRDQLKQMFRTLRAIPTERVLSSMSIDRDLVRILENFRKEYGFKDPEGRRCCFYRTACYINHACGKCAQASWCVDNQQPNCISVTLNRPVKAGEEIFIHYGKKNLSYGCAVCTKENGPKKTSFLERSKNKLSRWLRRNREE
ncbi:hypothetical protein FPOAC2_00467 [Fusarium poae]|jgi:hypothetical protein|uniref:hypothetical protein n=1 Tax=Fusarium poae TaxID=36050 RepID=UPI001CE87702|nr:hypothetical protein FPOAC1_000414 [Fusarium poae]KAG8674446.1 hypothetical protein FPOAC1_000414 [Fusarium poae]